MNSEVNPGQYIDEFESAEPKFYAFRVYDSITRQPVNTVCIIRGINLKNITSKQVNFDVINVTILGAEAVGDGCGPVIVHTEKKVKRKKKRGGDEWGSYVTLVTATDDKIYRISFYKRRRL